MLEFLAEQSSVTQLEEPQHPYPHQNFTHIVVFLLIVLWCAVDASCVRGKETD